MTRCAEVYFHRPRIFDFVVQLLPWKEARTCPVFTFNDAVEALAYDRLNSRLAITSHSGHVKLFEVDKCKSFCVVLMSILISFWDGSGFEAHLGHQYRERYSSCGLLLWRCKAISFDISS
jgi:hypothetical protein